MIQLKRTCKSILKYKTSSVLTLLSLVISFTGIIILSLYVSFEKSFDQFHENVESVYRLETRDGGSWLPAAMSQLIKENVPEVEAITPLWHDKQDLTTPGLAEIDVKFHTEVYFAGSDFFNVFSFPLLLGDAQTSLIDPKSAVISEELSHKLFGTSNPLGKNILADGISYKVTAVMAGFPTNSSLKADCLLSFSTCKEEKRYSYFDYWSEWSFNNFMKLSAGSSPQLVAEKIEKVPRISEEIAEEKEQYKVDGTYLSLNRLDQLHFSNDGYFEFVNPVILNVLVLLIVILVVMGGVNFVNFATSQAPVRAKALSISRVLGGKRFSSMGQLIGESVLLSLAALIVSMIIYWGSYPSIESLFNIQGLSLQGRYGFLWLFLLFSLAFGVLAGLYPARYITSAPIAQIVKGTIHFSGKGKAFRNTLIVAQFVFTIALISASLVIEKQLSFWRNFDIGINKEQVIHLHTSAELQKHHQAFADELMKNERIVDYTYAQFVPGNVGMGWGRTTEDGQYIQFTCWPVDDRFLGFFGIEMTDGRKFSEGSQADVNSFILNEKAVAEFGWINPLQRQLNGFDFNGPIIGVAKNFNFSSLRSDVAPLAFWRCEGRKNNLMLRVTPGNYTQIMADIKNTAHQFDPKNQFEVKFLDDSLNTLYAKEEKMAHLIEFVSMWCILLSIAGLLGLVIFISRDRVKEIGIRKVNGAKISEILTMLNRDFVKWVAIAFVIATPIAWYAMNKWLENFAYKTELSWWIFALAGLLALGIALLTVSWQSWKAATRNPVEALRYE
jgi:putative ABC transport system permease protein